MDKAEYVFYKLAQQVAKKTSNTENNVSDQYKYVDPYKIHGMNYSFDPKKKGSGKDLLSTMNSVVAPEYVDQMENSKLAPNVKANLAAKKAVDSTSYVFNKHTGEFKGWYSGLPFNNKAFSSSDDTTMVGRDAINYVRYKQPNFTLDSKNPPVVQVGSKSNEKPQVQVHPMGMR